MPEIKKFDTVEYEQHGPIVVIRMNNPARRNSMNFTMRRGMNAAFAQFETDESARVAILTGVGNSFCSGIDTKDMVNQSPEERRKNTEERKELNRIGAYELRDRILKPTIAAVNGWAVGHGWFMAHGCDLVFAAESAIFWQNEPVYGFQGGGRAIATQMIPFHLGVEIALAAKIPAKRAYEMGLINRVVPDDQLMPEAMAMAEHICSLAPLAVEIIIRSCRSARLSSAIPSVIELSNWQEYNWLGSTEDVKEGFKAYAEKRKPQWKGR